MSDSIKVVAEQTEDETGRLFQSWFMRLLVQTETLLT